VPPCDSRSMTRGPVRTLRLSDRLRHLFARARSVPGHEPGAFQGPHWEAEDYSQSLVAAPLVNDPWETDPEHSGSTQPSEVGGLLADRVAVSTCGRGGSTSEAPPEMSPPLAVEDLRTIEAATEAQNSALKISNSLTPPPELGQRSPSSVVAAGARSGPSPPTVSANENSWPGLPHPESGGLGVMRHWGDAHTDEAGTLNERSTADGEAKDEMLRGDERNTADGIRGDADPGTDFEEHTLAETVKDLGFQLKNRDGLVDDTAIDEPFDYDPDARQGPWGDSEHDESGDKDYIRHAREKAAIIASVIEVSSRIDQEAIFDWLTELFLEFRHPATFRAIERVASQSITPDLLRALIALRRYWMERPEWWVSRYDLRRHERPLGNGSKGLGWAVALRVCRHRAEYEAEDMIDESWFHEWLALSPGAPGYFSFAAYVNSKVTNPDSELLYEGLVRIKVRWGAETEEWVSLADVEPGFQVGWTVQDIPLSASRRSLGVGQVVGQRVLGGRHQILMQLHDEGRSLWLPYENLRRLMDVRLRFSRAIPRVADHGERFRLRLLAHALENWNHLTGSLDRLDVEPLPHQIQLVHRILSSGNYNWLIADDVGLGKTIEVGLLLAALKRKNQARRVLIIAPAGLTRQWQDELRYKFDQMYEIYGRDFTIVQPDHWKIHDHVIVSLDLAKREDHLENFQRAGAWDIVIFDEGHKLTRYASGERAQRYRLAEVLRLKTDALLLLSGTPHQGYADRFRALLARISQRGKVHRDPGSEKIELH